MHAAGLRGYLPMYIQRFLSQRSFKVRLNNVTSSEYIQVNGVPQGSLLSVTLFALKINSIVNSVPQNSNWISSLYVDDLQIAIRYYDIPTAGQEIQKCINDLQKWTVLNGFKFSVSKTKILLFSNKSRSNINLN